MSHAVAKGSTRRGTGKGKGEENFPEVLKAEKSKSSWENLLKIRRNEQQVQNNGGTDTRTLLTQGSGEHTVECTRKGRAMSRRHPYTRPRVAKLRSVDLDSALRDCLWKLWAWSREGQSGGRDLQLGHCLEHVAWQNAEPTAASVIC